MNKNDYLEFMLPITVFAPDLIEQYGKEVAEQKIIAAVNKHRKEVIDLLDQLIGDIGGIPVRVEAAEKKNIGVNAPDGYPLNNPHFNEIAKQKVEKLRPIAEKTVQYLKDMAKKFKK